MLYLINFIMLSSISYFGFISIPIEINIENIASALVVISILSYIMNLIFKYVLITVFVLFISFVGYGIYDGKININSDSDFKAVFIEIKDHWLNKFEENKGNNIEEQIGQ